MFPASWNPSARKKRKTFLDETDQQAAEAVPVVFESGLHQSILRQLNTGAPSTRQSQLALDHILSKVPYRTMLENLFKSSDTKVQDVPILSRSFEESFMRQPLSGEQACVMGDQCECMHIDRSAPFVGVELRFHGDPETPQMCVLCTRALTQKCYYDVCFLSRPVKGVIQRYGNIFDQQGEYSVECMLALPRSVGPSCMPVPCVSHQRNRYSVEMHGGVKNIRQHRPLKSGSSLTIHRLQWGIPKRILAARLEGCPGSLKHIKSKSNPCKEEQGEPEQEPEQDHRFIPECPELDREVESIHVMARHGLLSPEDAERQINSYLLAAAYLMRTPSPRFPPRWLLLRICDAPQPDTLPDIAGVIHRMLIRDPIACCITSVLELCVPCLRQSSRPIAYEDSQHVLLQIVSAFVLGTYPEYTKKPCFRVRAALFGRIHSLMTADPEHQTRFCLANEPIILLACMEYLARILPLNAPVMHACLAHGDPATGALFARIPLLCDDIRQRVNELACFTWSALLGWCSEGMERVSRLKRGHRPPQPRHHAEPMASTNTSEHWMAPYMPAGSENDYKLLAMTFGLSACTLQYIQRELRVFRLPGNLRDIQARALQGCASITARVALGKFRRYVCTHCFVVKKGQYECKLRMDAFMQRLVCSTCQSTDILHVDLLGCVLRCNKEHYYLCPACLTVHEYQATELVWQRPVSCPRSRPRPQPQGRQRLVCDMCEEPSATTTVTRVDHLTGALTSFHYCQRHSPRREALEMCCNVRQLMQENCRASRSARGRGCI